MPDTPPTVVRVPGELIKRTITTLGACAVTFHSLNFTGPIDDIMQLLKDYGLPDVALEAIRKNMKEN